MHRTATDKRRSGNHLRVQQCVLAQLPVKKTAMTIRPIHHRRDRQPCVFFNREIHRDALAKLADGVDSAAAMIDVTGLAADEALGGGNGLGEPQTARNFICSPLTANMVLCPLR
ncbi:MAG: hypothetical protein AAF727_11840 [Pseudomonadota bacterium]